MGRDQPRHGQSVVRLLSRLEHAKLQLDLAHSHTVQITLNPSSLATPLPDAKHAHQCAIRADEHAVNDYLKALNDLEAALLPKTGREKANGSNGLPGSSNRLTPRQRQVLTLIASGRSSREVAGALGIAFKTAVVHRHNIQTKLKVHNTADLTRAAMAMGLIDI